MATLLSSNIASGLRLHLPDAFLDTLEPARGDLVAAGLPLVEELGWEAELRDPGSGLDHMICVRRHDGSLDEFLRWCDRPSGREKLHRHPEWRRLRSFFVELGEQRSPYSYFDNCWLEFDLSDPRANWEVPNFFVGFEPPLCTRRTSAADFAAVMHALGLVRGAPIPEPIRSALATCWSQLPGNAEIFQFGLMLPRDVDRFRLVVRGCRPDQMLEYLNGIGWSGNQRWLRALTAKLYSFATGVSLAITVGERVHPKVGFECHFGPRDPSVTPRWERFFEFLVAHGLCRPSAWAALREWPGTCALHAPPHAGTEPLEAHAIKGFSHVKVSFGTGFPLEAKLYFGALVKRRRTQAPATRREHVIRSWRKHHVVQELSALPRPTAFTDFPLLNASLDYLLGEWCNEFPDAAHIMTFPAAEGFRNETENHVGIVFPRVVIADALTDANELLRGRLDPLLAEEVDVAVRSKRAGAGWAYFSELMELPPDSDTLAQVLQVLIRNGAWKAVEAHARPLVELAIREISDVPGTVSTWLIPAAGRTEVQQRQHEYACSTWGHTPDTEVIANFLYALSLLDRARYRMFLTAGTSYVQGAMEPGGWWRSIWYHGPFYGTYVALRLLARMHRPVPDASLAFLLGAQRRSGAWGSEDADEVLSTALALLALLVVRRAGTTRRRELDASIDRAVAWLTDRCRTPDDLGRDPFIRMDLKRATDLPAHVVTWGSPTVSAAYVLKAMASVASRSHAAPA